MRYIVIVFVFWYSFALQAKSKLVLPQLMQHAYYGAFVVNLEDGDTLVRNNAEASFSPASLTKLVTTATALQLLTPEYNYETILAYTGNIKVGILDGDLLVIGSGDPSFCSEYISDRPWGVLHAWINHLQKNGVKKVTGDVLVDASIFDSKVIGDKWIWEDVGNYYGAGVYGLSFMDNRYYLSLKSEGVGDPVKVVGLQPQTLDMTFDCSVVGADNNRDNAYIYGSPWTFDRRVRGTIPAGRDRFVIKGAMPNPPATFAYIFAKLLKESGIVLEGDVLVDWDGHPRVTKMLAVWSSPELKALVSITNKQSNNLYAEHILKTLAIGDKPATTASAIDTLMGYWSGQGVSCDGVKLYDGSGLSRANLLTPDFVVGVLKHMDTSPYVEDFKASLAIAGYDGTFKYFLENTPLADQVIGKSGGMSGVRCYAGYAHWQGHNYAFCVMVNNSTASMAEMKAAIEEYLLQIFS